MFYDHQRCPAQGVGPEGCGAFAECPSLIHLGVPSLETGDPGGEEPQEEKATVAMESARETEAAEVEGKGEDKGNHGHEDRGRRRAGKL